MKRLFCATVYVFDKTGTNCLMLKHKKLQKWLPPGGKIDPNELPDTAAIRECLEETGVKIKLIGEKTPVTGGLIRPDGIQLNTIIPNELDHIDLIYLAQPEQDTELVLNQREAEEVKWIPIQEVLANNFDTFPSVKEWIKKFATQLKK